MRFSFLWVGIMPRPDALVFDEFCGFRCLFAGCARLLRITWVGFFLVFGVCGDFRLFSLLFECFLVDLEFWVFGFLCYFGCLHFGVRFVVLAVCEFLVFPGTWCFVVFGGRMVVVILFFVLTWW